MVDNTESWIDEDGVHWVNMSLGETKDYFIDWTDRLTDEGDTLDTIVWTVPTGLTKEKQTNDGVGKAYIFLTADDVGTYNVKCSIDATELSDTNTYIRTMILEVTEY